MVFKPKPGVVATPVFRPAPAAYKDYAEPAYVEVLCGTPEAEIYYTVDGPVPQKDLAPSRRYSSPVRVEAGQTIRAVAYRVGGWTQSRMAEGYYGPPKEPVASAPAETQPASAPARPATGTSAAGPPAAPARLPVAPASSPAGTMPAK